MAPFDLASAELVIERFAASLHAAGDSMESDSDLEAEAIDDDSDPDDELPLSVSQEVVDEEYMWKLANMEQWTSREWRNLTFVENAIALPRIACCAECELEGKSFSKKQLARHPDDRRCRECVSKAQMKIGSTTKPLPKQPAPRALSVATPMPVAMASGQGPPAPSIAQCCACGEKLSKENCSASQRTKVPSRRRCNECVGGGASAIASAIVGIAVPTSAEGLPAGPVAEAAHAQVCV